MKDNQLLDNDDPGLTMTVRSRYISERKYFFSLTLPSLQGWSRALRHTAPSLKMMKYIQYTVSTIQQYVHFKVQSFKYKYAYAIFMIFDIDLDYYYCVKRLCKFDDNFPPHPGCCPMFLLHKA